MTEVPKIFVSYSWSSPEHEGWVLNLCSSLESDGIAVVLDKWDLKEGQDPNVFMESMVHDPSVSKVVMVCDDKYVDRANNREGGVGTETQIISAQVFKSVTQSKFVAITRSVGEDGKPRVPHYYGDRIFIPFHDEATFTDSYDKLIRWIFGRPRHERPPRGKRPTYLTEDAEPIWGTAAAQRRALTDLRSGSPGARASLEEYILRLVQAIAQNQVTDDGQDGFDEKVILAIEKFIPVRNECIDVFVTLAQGAFPDLIEDATRLLLEKAWDSMHPAYGTGSYRDGNFDVPRFIVHELVLYLVAALLRRNRFDVVHRIVSSRYYLRRASQTSSSMMPFNSFRQPARSLLARGERVRRLSVRADLLNERTASTAFSYHELVQAEFVIFLRDAFDAKREKRDIEWWPETLALAERDEPLEVFARAESSSYFDRLKVVFEIAAPVAISALMEDFGSGALTTPRWSFRRSDLSALANSSRLASRP